MPRRAAAALLSAAVVLGVSPFTTSQAAAPSAEDVAAQRAEADRLRDDVSAHQAEVARSQARLDELAAAAAAALEDYTLAVQAQMQAEAAHWEESERLTQARVELNDSRGELGRWAARTYRDNGSVTGLEGLMSLLEAESTDDLGLRLSMLSVVGRAQGGAVREASDAADAQADQVTRSAETARAVTEATAAAVEAKAASDRLIAEQRAEHDRLAGLLLTSRTQADVAAEKAAMLEHARAQVLQGLTDSAPATNLDGLNVVTGITGSCQGGDVARYGNGQIPASALCPLWGAPGHLLRADAAYAFDRLAEAYAADHGRAICVTDSYRTYASQVRLKAQKPRLAARPGTSNHGWGTAVDLCGGIQSFGTPQHRWMQLNAPRFGWFNPRWAQQTGSKPEAWHWEFGG